MHIRNRDYLRHGAWLGTLRRGQPVGTATWLGCYINALSLLDIDCDAGVFPQPSWFDCSSEPCQGRILSPTSSGATTCSMARRLGRLWPMPLRPPAGAACAVVVAPLLEVAFQPPVVVPAVRHMAGRRRPARGRQPAATLAQNRCCGRPFPAAHARPSPQHTSVTARQSSRRTCAGPRRC